MATSTATTMWTSTTWEAWQRSSTAAERRRMPISNHLSLCRNRARWPRWRWAAQSVSDRGDLETKRPLEATPILFCSKEVKHVIESVRSSSSDQIVKLHQARAACHGISTAARQRFGADILDGRHEQLDRRTELVGRRADGGRGGPDQQWRHRPGGRGERTAFQSQPW